MIKSKLFEILKTLSDDEMKKFCDFVNSPFFNKKKILTDLIEAYKHFHSNYEDEKFNKEMIYSKIFKGSAYNDQVFRNLNSGLYKLLLEFIAIGNIYRHPFNIHRHILSELNERKIVSLFENHFTDAAIILEESPERDNLYFLEKFFLLSERDYNDIINSNFNTKQLKFSERYLIIFFLMNYLETANMIKYRARILKLREKPDNDKFLITMIKSLPVEILNLPQIQIPLALLKLEETNEKKYYDKLIELLKVHGSKFEKSRQFGFYLNLMDYIRRNNSITGIETVKQLFDLRNMMIEKNLFGESDALNYMFFINQAKAAVRLKKFDWLENFISKHGKNIDHLYRKSAINLCKAFSVFHKGSYPKALDFLNGVSYDNVFFNIEIKHLKSRIFYEMKEIDLLLSNLNSYKMYIFNNKNIEEDAVNANMLFVNIMFRIVKIYENKKYHKLEQLEKDINSINDIYAVWLLEKIHELKMKYFESK